MAYGESNGHMSNTDCNKVNVYGYCIFNDEIAIRYIFMLLHFYRAMHFSAKRGIAIACRLSVRLSVCLSVCL